MLHTKIIDTQKEQIKISDAEQLLPHQNLEQIYILQAPLEILTIIKK